MRKQNYEKYWKFTAAYTDYNGEKFLKTLKIIVDFIDKNKPNVYAPKLYEDLIVLILHQVSKEGSDPDASSRKAVNQLVKLGFISPFLKSYHKDVKSYLEAKTNRKRQSIFSKIVYSNASFNSSIINKSGLHQINFLINTLIENGKLSINEIIALMLVDIGSISRGFLSKDKLNEYVDKANKINFIKRKYNQIGYLINLLKKLDGIVFVKDELYFKEDAKQIFGEDWGVETQYRNPYLHLLYKNQLKEESFIFFNEEKCMVEKLAFPILIASHIKPFIKSNEDEAYDPDNGLLLSQNMDGLFDKGYISFNDDGSIVISEQLDKDLKSYLVKYKLDKEFLKDKRKTYMNYHRQLFKDRLGIDL